MPGHYTLDTVANRLHPDSPATWSNGLNAFLALGLVGVAILLHAPSVERVDTFGIGVLTATLCGYNLYRRRETGHEHPELLEAVFVLNLCLVAVLLTVDPALGVFTVAGLVLSALVVGIDGAEFVRTFNSRPDRRVEARRHGLGLRAAVRRYRTWLGARYEVFCRRVGPVAPTPSPGVLWFSTGTVRDLFDGSAPRRHYLPLVLAIPVGIGAGIGAAAFRYLMYAVHGVLFDTVLPMLPSNLWIVALPVAGAAVAGLLIYTFAPEAAGHGVPENMEAVSDSGGRIRHRLAPFKVLVSALVLGSGGSGGREGPIARIGAGLGSSLGQVFDLCDENIRLLLSAGIAAGIGATFGAPIGGVFFVLEIVMAYRVKLFNVLVLSVATLVGVGTADLIAPHFVWFSFLPFAIPDLHVTPTAILYAIPYGVLLGLVAALWVSILERTETTFDGLAIPDTMKPAIGAIPVGILGIWFAKYGVMGVGYSGLRLAVTHAHMGALLLIALAVSKLVATQFTIGSGGSGGVFAPTLYLGGMFAVGVHQFAGLSPVSAPILGIVGMAAAFSGAAFAPLTGMFLVAETFNSYPMVAVLAVPCLLSSVVARRLLSASIYTSRLHRRGILSNYAETARSIGPVSERDDDGGLHIPRQRSSDQSAD